MAGDILPSCDPKFVALKQTIQKVAKLCEAERASGDLRMQRQNEEPAPLAKLL